MSATSKKKPASKDIKSTPFSKFVLVIFVLFFAVIGGYLILHSKAAGPPPAPSIYLTPGTLNLNVGDTFSVGVYENSGTDSVNAVQANLSYPTNLVSYVSYTNSSAFQLDAQSPSSNTGLLKFARASCAGCTPATGTQLVVTINFKVVGSGTAAVNFASGTAVVRSSDNKYEDPLGQGNGSYNIATPPTTPPPSNPPPTGSTTPPKPPTSTTTNKSATNPTPPAPAASTTTNNSTATDLVKTPVPVASTNENQAEPQVPYRGVILIASGLGLLACLGVVGHWLYGRKAAEEAELNSHIFTPPAQNAGTQAPTGQPPTIVVGPSSPPSTSSILGQQPKGS